MRTIHDWLKYVQDSKRHVARSERPEPPVSGPVHLPAASRTKVSEPSGPGRKEPPPPAERQAPPPVRVKRGSESLPASVRPIEAQPVTPPRTRRSTQSPQRMKELMASLDAALQIPLPLPPPARESAARSRSRSRFSESRESLVRRLIDPELRLREVALLLGVCPATVRRYANRGSLPSVRTGGNQRRFRLSDVVDFLHRRSGRSAQTSGDLLADELASAIPPSPDGAAPPDIPATIL